MDPIIGTMLDDRYEILDVLGSGGMAVVYKAMCHRLNRLVAIKILKRDFGQDAEMHRRFQTESQAVAMLSHPNIVSVYDVSSSETLDYIVMELIDGITLKQYMQKKGVLTWREALHFSLQIASALDHAHSRGIIHRDIKPHNIMILKDGSIKVADFGIARVLSEDNTLTRETLGSVHYISPEQARGGRIDQRTDLYSLGVVMYEMLTGRLPYDGDSAVSIAIKHIGGQCPEPKELNPEIPEGLNQIVMHAMSVDPAERYASAAAMSEDLEEFRKDQHVVFSYIHTEPKQPLPAAVPKQQEDETRQRRGSRVMAVIVIAFMLLAFAGIGYFLYSYILRDLFKASEELPAPDLRGVYYTELTEERYPDFKLVVEQWTTSDTVEYGYVVSQEPKEKKNVKPGATIRVTVSSGRQENTMPRLVNMNQGAAEQRLKETELGLDVQIIRETSEIFVSGQVIRTEPEAGAALNRGETVLLYVSSGAEVELVLVPKLVGMNVDEALAQIRAYGLEPGTVVYRTDEAEADTVIYQSTPHNTEVKASTVINLRVSSGPEEEEPEEDPEEKTDEKDDPDEKPEEDEKPPEQLPPVVKPKPETPTPVPGDDNAYDAGNPKPGEYTRSILNVDLPVGVGTVTVSLLCDGVKYGDGFIVDLEKRSIQIAVYGTGSREFDVLVNGSRISYVTVDFPEG